MITTSSNDEQLEAIYNKLDALTVTYLTKLNQYTLNRNTSSDPLQKGFMDLAHAKYTMGAKTISHYSYDERMKAKLQIKINQQNDQPFEMLRPIEVMKESVSTGLRQRKDNKNNNKKQQQDTEWMQKDPNDIVEKEEYEMDEKKPTKKEKRNIVKANSGDPLHWFGLLVSPSLRTSQAHFKSATAQIIEMVNLVYELDKLEEEYIHLERKKQELLQAKQQQEREDEREALQVNT